MSTATQHTTAEQVFAVDPSAALQIAINEREKAEAQAAAAREEYRALSDVEFDASGRIKKATMAGMWRLSQMYASSTLVPAHYQNSPSNCFIACQMAFRMGIDPLAFMQNSYIVHGRPGIEAKLAIAALNTSGLIKGRVTYERIGSGKSGSCVAKVVDRESGETIVGAPVTWELVSAEGWSKRGDSKWNTMPDLMFQYRAAMFLIRTIYPEVVMGIKTVDELLDEPIPVGDLVDATEAARKPRGGKVRRAELPDLAEAADQAEADAAPPNGHEPPAEASANKPKRSKPKAVEAPQEPAAEAAQEAAHEPSGEVDRSEVDGVKAALRTCQSVADARSLIGRVRGTLMNPETLDACLLEIEGWLSDRESN